MYKQKTVLSIITARAGSKGLKNKNLKKLNNIPLFLWPINSSLKSKIIDQTVITTDSKEILKYPINKKVIKIKRPKKISGDKSSSIDALLHVIKELKKKDKYFDYLILLEPTSPLTNEKDIDYCLKKLINKKKVSSLLSIQKVIYSHPAYMYSKKKGYLYKRFPNETKNRRQDLDNLFCLDGSLYISKINELIKFKSFVGGKVIGVEFNKIKNFEIDDKIDLKILNKIFKLR